MLLPSSEALGGGFLAGEGTGPLVPSEVTSVPETWTEPQGRRLSPSPRWGQGDGAALGLLPRLRWPWPSGVASDSWSCAECRARPSRACAVLSGSPLQLDPARSSPPGSRGVSSPLCLNDLRRGWPSYRHTGASLVLGTVDGGAGRVNTQGQPHSASAHVGLVAADGPGGWGRRAVQLSRLCPGTSRAGSQYPGCPCCRLVSCP